MLQAPGVIKRPEGRQQGLRMGAEEFFQLPDDGCDYELIDGVVVMTPSPNPMHQDVTMEIAFQIRLFLSSRPLGKVLPEIDVHLGQGPGGGDLVYRPDLVFIRSERVPQMRERITGSPDLVVEIVSPGSRRLDNETKKHDYERFGVSEYWLIDPAQGTMTFYRLEEARYVEVPPEADRFTSQAVPGFALDLARLRTVFSEW